MARYVDGFLIPIPKKKLAAYKKIATLAGKVWMELGALAYVETLADDLPTKKVRSFARAAQAKPGETVLFSWIVYKSRKQRDEINKKIMKDPRLTKMMNEASPFDMNRMCYGGFKAIVDR